MKTSKFLFIAVLYAGFLTSCWPTIDDKEWNLIKKVNKASTKIELGKLRISSIENSISKLSNLIVRKLVKKEQIPETDKQLLEDMYKKLSEAKEALKKVQMEYERLIETNETARASK